MVNEKIKILKMLEEGRISAEDAAKLLSGEKSDLNTLAYPESAGFSSLPNNGPRPEPAKRAETTKGAKDTKSTEGSPIAQDLSRRLEGFFNKMEPKLQKFAEVVVEKTGSATKEISKEISKSIAAAKSAEAPPRPYKPQEGGFRPTHAAPPGSGAKARLEKSIEMVVKDAESELVMSGLNGQVLLKGYNGDKITAKIFYTVRHGNPDIDILALGNKYYLSYDENLFESVSIDAYIPEAMFASFRISNINGPIVAATLVSPDIRIESQNGDIEASNITAGNLIIETSNGTLRLKDIHADRAAIDDNNGTISAANLDIAQMKIGTLNGGVNMQMGGFNHYREYAWDIETSNAKIALVMPSSVDIGYHIKAAATLGEIRLGLSGLNFLKNSKTEVWAESTNFDLAPRKVTMYLETSNQPIIVN